MSFRASAPTSYGRNRIVDQIMRGLMVAATLVALVPLALILGYVAIRGAGALSLTFFSDTYRPPLAVDDASLAPAEPSIPADPAAPTADPNDPFANIDVGTLAGADDAPTTATEGGDTTGEQTETAASAPQGGVLHGIVGTLLVAGLALLIAMPVGVLAGVFLAEFPGNSVATVVRFACDVLSGAPSIVIGVVGYVLIVQRFQGFSGFAGSIALTFLMVPTITRTTEEILKLVPHSTREAASAMGAPMWYSTFTVVIPAASAGIVTGVLLAFARGAGETAPLILTVLGNNELSFDLLKPIAALPLLTYRYTESPFPAENTLAWGTALVLVVLVLGVNLLVRLATRSRLRVR